MGLRDVESSLPPGFRFHPSDDELVCHYLYKKVANERAPSGGTMVEVDLHTREPWELPEVAKLTANEWYFFSFRDRKYATGSRTNRATRSGYWKATGKDRIIHDPATHAIVGMRKTLVFYSGRAPNGLKSCWVMHEFRLESPHAPPKEDWVLCRVFHKRKLVESVNNIHDHVNLESSTTEHHVNIIDCPSPQMDASPPPPALMDQQGTVLDGCFDLVSSSFTNPAILHQEDISSNPSFQNLPLLHYNLAADFPQEIDMTSQMMDQMGSRSTTGDEYCGFFFDDTTAGGAELEDQYDMGAAGLPSHDVAKDINKPSFFFR